MIYFKQSIIRFALVLFFIIPNFLNIAHAQNQQNEISWLKAHFPPFTILKGKYANTGMTDRFQTLIEDNLPEYTHKTNVTPMNYKRILANLKQGKHVCSPALLKTPEREKFIAYSESFHAVYPPGLIIKKINRFISSKIYG